MCECVLLCSVRKHCCFITAVSGKGVCVCVCVSDKNQLKVPDLNADSLLEIENSLS